MKSPKCCEKIMELKSVTEVLTGGSVYLTYHFQCKKCGKIKSSVREQ